jgi:hypothetical protein
MPEENLRSELIKLLNSRDYYKCSGTTPLRRIADQMLRSAIDGDKATVRMIVEIVFGKPATANDQTLATPRDLTKTIDSATREYAKKVLDKGGPA